MLDQFEKVGGGVKHVETSVHKLMLGMELLLITVSAFWCLTFALVDQNLFAQPEPAELVTVFVMSSIYHTLAKREARVATWERLEWFLRRIAGVLRYVLLMNGLFWLLKMSFWDRTLFKNPGWSGLLALLIIAGVCHTFLREEAEKKEG